MNFNSHIDIVVTVAVRLVNAFTAGEAHGRPYTPPDGRQLGEAVAAELAAAHETTAAADAASPRAGGSPGAAPRGSTAETTAAADAASPRAGGSPGAAPRGGTDATAGAGGLTAALGTAPRAARPRVRRVSAEEAEEFSAVAGVLRTVFEAVAAGDLDTAAGTVNALLERTGARPCLDKHDGEPWHLHFTSTHDSLVAGWVAGCATGLAIVLGTDDRGRLGVCAAPRCDRVYIDTSRNSTKRFCSTSCQNRVKTAAFRGRGAGPGRRPPDDPSRALRARR